MLNWLMRYKPVVRLLDELQAGTVVDVGSGWHGISTYRAGKAVQTDLAFSGAPPTGKRLGHPLYVAATADGLPFPDDAFDYAVSLDLFEHLPGNIREESVRELCRVAQRGVLVGFPVGRPARAVDICLYWLMFLFRRGIPEWLSEHREQARYPDRTMLVDSVPDGWTIARDIKSGNVISQVALVMAERLPGLARLTRWLECRWRATGVPAPLDRGLTYRRVFVLEPPS